MPDTPVPQTPSTCPQCGTVLAPGLLSCPGCQRLVHAETLKVLATDAERAAQAGDLSAALGRWRQALELLPPDSRQHQAVKGKIAALSDQLGGVGDTTARLSSRQTAGATTSVAPARRWGMFAAAGAVLVFVLSKAKLLLTGLSKAGTLWTMLLSFGVYWTIWGWQFAAGVVLSIYVHEMGHVAALRRYGIPATAPMFIPGVGALVRLKQNPATPSEDAAVGLAGPVWGLGAACAAFVLYWLTLNPLFAALADIGAFVNLFNLLPLGPLDGGRGFRALSRGQRWLVVLAVFGAWYAAPHGLLIIIGILALLQALAPNPPQKPDHRALLTFVLLIAALVALATVAAPLATAPGTTAPGPAATPAR